MKIGVLTFVCAQNWGAVLQGYSIQEFINIQTEHECVMLKWEPVDDSLFKPYKTIPNLLHSLLHINQCKKRIKKFQAFRNNYLIWSSECYTDKERKKLNEKYDAFIVGSDQVWNSLDYINPTMFLDFADNTSRKIAYAPSFGADYIADGCEKELKKYIEKFHALSVREKSGMDIIHKFSDISVALVVDPIFLNTPEFWRQIARKPEVKEKYIFAYPTQITKNFCLAVQILKQATNLQIYTPFYIPGCHTIKDMGIDEFLGWIDCSEYVLATSFHATAFSILFEKEFLAIPHTMTGARIIDLLDRFHLRTALALPDSSLDIEKRIDYSKITPLVKQEAEYSREWLKTALK